MKGRDIERMDHIPATAIVTELVKAGRTPEDGKAIVISALLGEGENYLPSELCYAMDNGFAEHQQIDLSETLVERDDFETWWNVLSQDESDGNPMPVSGGAKDPELTRPEGKNEGVEQVLTWKKHAQAIADECFDRDTANNCRDSLTGYAKRVMDEMQKRKIHGPRGRIDNPKTIQRDALQGAKWWANKKNK